MNKLPYWYLRGDTYKAGGGPKAAKDRYEYYDKGRWMWLTPGFIHAAHHPEMAVMFDLVPFRTKFVDKGVLTDIELNAANATMLVVKNPNGDRLNQFIVDRINQ